MTNEELLADWDAGKPIKTVSMGGFGHDYETALQTSQGKVGEHDGLRKNSLHHQLLSRGWGHSRAINPPTPSLNINNPLTSSSTVKY